MTDKRRHEKTGELHSRGKDEALHRDLGSFDHEPEGKHRRRALRFDPRTEPSVTPVGDPIPDAGVTALPNAALGFGEGTPEPEVMTEPHAPINPDALDDSRAPFHGGPEGPNEDREPPTGAGLAEEPDFDAPPSEASQRRSGFEPPAHVVSAVTARIPTGGAFDALARALAAEGAANRWRESAAVGHGGALAPHLSEREHLTHAIIHTWNRVSPAKDARPYDLARAAAQEFGLHREGMDHVGAATRAAARDEDLPALREFLRGQYAHTQEALAAQGQDFVTAERGMSFEKARLGESPELVRRAAESGGPVRHESLPVEPAALSSHALGRPQAQVFASRGTHGLLYSADVPREQVLSTHETGMGVGHEKEVVLLGRPFTARAVAAPWSHFALGTPVALADAAPPHHRDEEAAWRDESVAWRDESSGLSEWEALALEEAIRGDENACAQIALDSQTPVWVSLDLSDERIEEIRVALSTPGQFTPHQARILHALHAAGGTANYHAIRAAAGGNVASHLRPLVAQGLVQPVGNTTGSPQHSLTPAGHAALVQTGGTVAPAAPPAPAPAPPPVTTPSPAPAPTPSGPNLGGTGAFHTGGTHRVAGGTAKNPYQAYHYAPGGANNAPPSSVDDGTGGLQTALSVGAHRLSPQDAQDLADLHDATAGVPQSALTSLPTSLTAAGYATQTGTTPHITAAGINVLRQAAHKAGSGNVASDQATWTHTASGLAAPSPVNTSGMAPIPPPNESASAQRSFTHAAAAQDVINTLVAHYAANPAGPQAAAAAIQADPEFQKAIAGLKQAAIALNSQKANANNPKYAKGGVVNPTTVARYQAELDHYREMRDVLADAAVRGIGVDVVRPVGAPAAHANLGFPSQAQAQPAAPVTSTPPPSNPAPAGSPVNAAQQSFFAAMPQDMQDVMHALHGVLASGKPPTLSAVHAALPASTTISNISRVSANLVRLNGAGIVTYAPHGNVMHFGLSPQGQSMMAAVTGQAAAPPAPQPAAPAPASPATGSPPPAPAATTPSSGTPALTPDEQAVLGVLTGAKSQMHFNSIRVHKALRQAGGGTFPTSHLTTALQGLMQKGLVAQHAALSAGKPFGQSYFMPVGAAGSVGSAASVTPHPTPAPQPTPPPHPTPVQGMQGVHNPPPAGGLQVGPNSSYIQMGAAAGQGVPGAPVLTTTIRAGRSTLPLSLSNPGPSPGSQPYLNAAKFPDRNHAADFGMTYQGPTGNVVKVWHCSSPASLKGAAVSGLRPGNTNAYGYGIYTGAGTAIHGYASGCNYLMELHTGRCVHTNNVSALVAQYKREQPLAAQKLAFDPAKLQAAACLHYGYSSIVTTYGSGQPSYVVLDPSRCRIESVTDNAGNPIPIPTLNGQKTAPPSVPMHASVQNANVQPGPGAPASFTVGQGPKSAWTGTPDLAAAKDPTLTARNAAIGADPNLPLSDNGYNAILRIGKSVTGKKMSKAAIDAGRAVARQIMPVRGVEDAQTLINILDSDAMISNAELHRRIAALQSDTSPQGQAELARLKSVPAKNNPDDVALGLNDSVFLTYGSPTAYNSYGPISIVYKREVLNTPGTKVNLHGVNAYNDNRARPLNKQAWADNEVDGAEAAEVMAFQLAAGYPTTGASGKALAPENGPLAKPEDYLGGHSLTAKEQAEVHVPTAISHHHISHILVPSGATVQIGGVTGGHHPAFGVPPGLYDNVTLNGRKYRADVYQQMNPQHADGSQVSLQGEVLTLRHVAQPDGTMRWQFEVPATTKKTVSLANHLHSVLQARGIDAAVIETAGSHGAPHRSVMSTYQPGGYGGSSRLPSGHNSVYEGVCWGSV